MFHTPPHKVRTLNDVVQQTNKGIMLEQVIDLLQRGEPVPLDLEAALMEQGIDVNFLYQKYSQ